MCRLESAEKTSLGISYTEMRWEVAKAVRDVYCDMLHDVIEEETGLLTRF